ncbi:phage tail protein [Pseudomonas salomonii]|uniref:Phage tail protein n=1 Tax=Pseudomonas salomonii TaxID=191391 RepID=A0A7Y8GC34_9PSED|nr:phage tail protein [Pseudomonas salomonii]NWF07936.1 phage tail protein [Pseudomonas salomonii]
MIDANSQFFCMLTAVGEAKQVKADAGLITWKITHMAVGDANNTDPIPDRLQKALINERLRRPLNTLGPDPANPAILVAEQVIPADEGGFWIREMGLFDSDGDLVAVANCAPSYKPKMSQGSGRTQTLRMNFVVKSSTNVVLLVDPSVVLATRKFVEDSVLNAVNALDYKASVLVATTAPIVLAGVQTIDGLVAPAGSRVLVKNQAKAAENGLYLVSAESWVRTVDADNGTKVTPGMQVIVERGAVHADTFWLLETDGVIILGTTSLTFVQRGSQGSYAGQTNYTGNTALTAADVGKLVNFAQLSTVALPPASSVAAGSLITIGSSLSGGVWVVAAAGDTLTNTLTEPGPFFIQVGSLGRFRRLLGGSGWSFDDGDASLKYSPGFAARLEGNGYQKFPSGLIEQWGVVPPIPAGGSVLINYPIKFPNGPLAIVPGAGASQAGSPGINSYNESAGQVRFWNASLTTGTQASTYFAKGI